MLHQKRSELLRLLFIVALLALTVGVVLVLSTNDRTVTISPSGANSLGVVKGNVTQSLNITITNSEGSDINEVRITKPGTVGAILCLDSPPGSWVCTNTSTYVEFTGSTIVADGSSQTFNFSINTPLTTGNESFDVRTLDIVSNFNTTKHNVSVDFDAPRVVNITIQNASGNIIANATTLSNGTLYLRLQDFIFNVTVYDTGGAEPASVALYYNRSSTKQGPSMVNPHVAGTYNSSVIALENVSRKTPFTDVFYNATILSSRFNANDSLAFAILVNDSVGNNNLTNGSFNMPGQNSASFFFNITLDGNAPLLSNVSVLNSSSVFGYNVTPSNRTLTVAVNANDTTYQYAGSSGVSSVVVYTSDNASKTTALSNNEGLWSITGSLLNFGASTGDHKITLSFLAKDAVGNENTTSISVEIDDDAPQFSLNSNYSNNFTSTNNSQINITASISNNLNLTHNVTINGPNGLIFNASLNVGAVTSVINGTSTWFTVKLNVTGGIFPRAETGNHTLSFSNLSQYGCPGGAETDGFVCQLQLNATDIFGRPNSTNITITFDNVAPAIVNITMNSTAASQRSNIAFKGGTQLNFTANAYNNIVNVTIGNASITSLSHVMPVVAGNYSFLINVSDFCVQQGACTINFSATDKAGNYNNSLVDSEGASFLILRDDVPPNITAPSVSGGNFTGPGSLSNRTLGIMDPVRIARSDRPINLTVNSVDYNSTSTVINVTLQNSTAATMALWNTSSDWYNITTLASLGCSANVESQCIITFNATDNASNVNNSIVSPQLNLTFRVDDLAPRIVNFTTGLTNGIGRNVTSVDTVINFSVNVSDANLWNVTIQNTTVIKMNSAGNTTLAVNHTSENTSVTTYWALVNLSILGCTSNGDCKITINATDLAGNVNASEFIFVTADSGTFAIDNRTFGATFLFDSTPTFNVNTSKAAICRYSTTGVTNYSQMTTSFDNNGTRHSSATVPSTADGSYEYDASCVDVTGANVKSTTVKFTIDTINDSVIVIDNSTQNVVFYFDNTPTITVNLSANALCRYSSTGGNNYTTMTTPFDVNGTRHNSFTLAATADGSYTYGVACATANEQNVVPGTVTFTVDTINDTTINIDNRTISATMIDATPTLHVNLSNNAMCRYSTTGDVTNFSQMTRPFNTNGTRHNSFTAASDLIDNDYEYPVSCTTANNQNVVSSTVTFSVDTTSLWNITIGATGALGAKADYFTQANRFYSTSHLKKTNVLDTTAVNARYNVTDVLASVMGASPGTTATNNLSVIWAYNRTGDRWTSFVYGRATNTFVNFTSDVMDYYFNFTVANERIEIN